MESHKGFVPLPCYFFLLLLCFLLIFVSMMRRFVPGLFFSMFSRYF